VVNRHAALLHQFFDVAIAQRIRHIPAHAHEHDVLRKMGPFEAYRHLSSLLSIALEHGERSYLRWPSRRIATEPQYEHSQEEWIE
jgi:hypothetical protein